MRESVGSTWLFGIVLAFTLIFSGFLVLALSYSKAYKLKNEVTSMIEKYEGLTKTDTHSNGGSIKIINQYLQNTGYKTKGHCENGAYGSEDLNSYNLVPAQSGKTYYYCISYKTDIDCDTIFNVTLFYNFNLPILGGLNKYNVSGQTTSINNAYFNGTPIKCK